MRFVDPPSLDSPWRGRHGDDLDGLLTAFFRAETPDPWPAAPVVEEAPPTILRHRPRRGLSQFRSRLVLAASVIFLLALPWFLSDAFRWVAPASVPSIEDQNTASEKLKFKTSLRQLPSGETGVRIDVDPDQKVIEGVLKDMNR